MKTPFSLVVCAWAFAGCALTNYTMVKPYTSGREVGSTTPMTKSVVWKKLELKPTLRNEPEAVAVKKNGYGMDTAYVFTNPKPQEWLTQAAKVEFQSVGLDMAGNGADDPSISIVVDQFFAEPDVSVWGADMTAVTVLDVTVNLPKQGKTFQRRFVGEDNSFEMVWPDSDFDVRLLKCAQLAFHEAAQETRKLIDGEGI
ncbi:MAG: hypothetical protein A2341_16140 [Deltaproteobacteria bacterium RIFOXYB12_FULL_58_9]|nr:MAG: hypothetical protein A2341_16140 [Deltaproteobacteria bacterium RIFOXYB12_FULL_58_9]